MNAKDDRHLVGPVLGHVVVGDLVVGDVDDRVQTRIVFMHEALHAALNNTTPFGAVLTAYHLLAQDIDAYGPAFRKLIAMCDAVHEAYATYLSLRILGLDATAVRGTFGYRDIYRRADLLVPNDLPGKTLMVEAGLRACMSPMVLSQLAEHDLSPDTPDLIQDEDQPNTRLLRLETADEVFWEHAWSRTIDAVHEHPGWPEWQLSAAGGDRPRDEAAEAVEDRIAELLFAEVAAWFDRRGMPVQPQTDLVSFGDRIFAPLQKRLYRNLKPLPAEASQDYGQTGPPQHAATSSKVEPAATRHPALGVKPNAAVVARQLDELRSLVAREGRADVHQALTDVLGTLRTVAASVVTAAREMP